MTRVDLYGTVHKALRSQLYESAMHVARADCACPEEARAVAVRLRAMLAFLAEHAEHEEAVILPELAKLAPEVHASLTADHARTEALEQEISALLERLDNANRVERTYLGRRIHQRMGVLVSEHTRHMNSEETQANEVLWARCTDAELKALEGRIIASIPGPRIAEWFAIILPAASLPEAGAMVADLCAALPTPVFCELTASARAVLGEAGWARILAAAGVPPLEALCLPQSEAVQVR